MISKGLYIIIIGCGRLGASLANKLSAHEHSIVVIDKRSEAFDLLNDEFSGFKIHGDANEFFVLQQAKVEKAEVVLAVTDDENLNVMLAQICKSMFDKKNVIARVKDPNRQSIYTDFGIVTLCPTSLAVKSFLDLLGIIG